VDSSREAIAATLRRFGKGLEPMGDFVTKIEATERDEEADSTLPLFAADAVPKPVPKEAARHRIIKDFALFAQDSCHGELGSLLEQWREWCGESRARHLCETPPPYRTRKPDKRKHSHS
jgi:hypothetical protein